MDLSPWPRLLPTARLRFEQCPTGAGDAITLPTHITLGIPMGCAEVALAAVVRVAPLATIAIQLARCLLNGMESLFFNRG